MSQQMATVACALLIMGLFALDWDRKTRTSWALWIPLAWLLIVGSREVSQWLAAFGLAATPRFDSPEQYLVGSPIDRGVFTALLALGVIVLASRGRLIGRLLRSNLPVVVFFLYCAVSTSWSDYSDVALKRWTKALGDVVMVMIVLTDPGRSAAIRRLLAWAAFLLIPLSVLLIKYYPDLGQEYNRWDWAASYGGVTLNKNSLGVTCLLLGLGSVWLLLDEYRGPAGAHRIRRFIAHGALLAMVLWLLWMSNSITSLSCFLLGSGLIAATKLRVLARKPAAVHFVVVAMVFVCLVGLFADAGEGLLQTMGRNPTLTGRTGIWKFTLGMAGNPVFGTGFESFWLGERLQKMWQIDPTINQAHNGYLEVFLNLGWIGVALLAVVIATGYRNVLMVFRRDRDAGRIRLAYFTVGLIYNFTEAGFRMMNPMWILFLLSTIAVPGFPPPRIRNIKARGAFRPILRGPACRWKVHLGRVG